MITLCTGCQARYRLDAAKVPARKIRVRCPACATVFDLDGTRRDEPAAKKPATVPAGASDLRLEPAAAVFAETQPAVARPVGPASVEAAPKPRPQPVAAPEPSAAGARPAAASAQAETAQPGRKRRRDKTEMLARALVSDILVYNQAARDKALAEGNLLEVLGPEIKKSWELYKEKVGPEAAAASNYFKDALNEILADGQHVF